jgi:hypothetical protein
MEKFLLRLALSYKPATKRKRQDCFFLLNFLAEREGFEPSVPLLAVHTISSRAPSASSDISPGPNPTRGTICYRNARTFQLWRLRTTSLKSNHMKFRGGEGGIRTHDPAFNRIPLFESGAFSHSATSPGFRRTGIQ